jgi:hypothetical protein
MFYIIDEEKKSLPTINGWKWRIERKKTDK